MSRTVPVLYYEILIHVFKKPLSIHEPLLRLLKVYDNTGGKAREFVYKSDRRTTTATEKLSDNLNIPAHAPAPAPSHAGAKRRSWELWGAGGAQVEEQNVTDSTSTEICLLDPQFAPDSPLRRLRKTYFPDNCDEEVRIGGRATDTRDRQKRGFHPLTPDVVTHPDRKGHHAVEGVLLRGLSFPQRSDLKTWYALAVGVLSGRVALVRRQS